MFCLPDSQGCSGLARRHPRSLHNMLGVAQVPQYTLNYFDDGRDEKVALVVMLPGGCLHLTPASSNSSPPAPDTPGGMLRQAQPQLVVQG